MTDNIRPCHYCSLVSFYKIITSKTLRLCNNYKMNDYFENKWFFIISDKVAKEIGTDNKVVRLYESQKEKYITIAEKLFIPHIISLSNAEVKLPLWREYADDGNGVAIEFDFKKLEGIINGKKNYSLEEVVYKQEKQEKIIRKIFLDKENESEPNLRKQLYNCFPLFKHPSFEYEKEYRIIYTATMGAIDYCKSGLFDKDTKFDYKDGKKKIFSYFEFPLDEEIIKKIHLGPKFNGNSIFNDNKTNFDLSDIHYFLIQNGFGNIEDASSICQYPYC